MRRAVLLSTLTLAGCGVSPGGPIVLGETPRRRTPVTLAASAPRQTRRPLVGPVRLRRAHGAEESFDRSQSVWITTVTLGRGMRTRTRSVLTVQRMPDGTFRETEHVVDAESDGAAVAVDATDEAQTVVGSRLEVRVDDHNRVVSPARALVGGDPQMLMAIRLALDRGRVPFPDREVRVGDRWEAEPFSVDFRPVGAWIRIDAEPRYRLEALEEVDGERIARIRWDVPFRIPPFSQLGPSVEGLGHARGVSTVALRDGRTGRTELEMEIGLRPASAPDEVPPLVRIGARYVETIRPWDAARP